MPGALFRPFAGLSVACFQKEIKVLSVADSIKFVQARVIFRKDEIPFTQNFEDPVEVLLGEVSADSNVYPLEKICVAVPRIDSFSAMKKSLSRNQLRLQLIV